MPQQPMPEPMPPQPQPTPPPPNPDEEDEEDEEPNPSPDNPGTGGGDGGQPCGNGVSGGTSSPPRCPPNEGDGTNVFSTYTGNAHRSVVDLSVFGSVGLLPLQLIRYSNTRAVPQNVGNGIFGREGVWTHNFQWLLRDSGPDPVTGHPRLRLTFPDGSDHFYVRQNAPVNGKATWLPRTDATSLLKQTNNSFILHLNNGNYYRFAKRAVDANQTAFFYRLEDYTDANNNRYIVSYTNGKDKLVRRVTDPSGRYFEFTYTEQQAAVSQRRALLAEVQWNTATPGQWHEVSVTNSKKSRYLALFYKNNYRNAPPLPISEIEFYDENNQVITGTAFGSGPLFEVHPCSGQCV
jgi:hypothetical protein